MANKFVGDLFNSRTQSHMFHLQTTSFAEHKALQEYYEAIVPLVDAWAEAYMGKYGPIKISQKSRFIQNNTRVREYFRNLLARIKSIKHPRDSYLLNIRDEIIALIETTIYKLSLK